MEQDEEDFDPPSKTRIKKELLALQSLALQLLELPASDLSSIAMDERLRDAIQELRSLTSHSARKRQMKFVAKLLRSTDLAPFHAALAARQAQQHAASEQLHTAEAWRERLLESDDAMVQWLASNPGSNRRQLRSLVKNARIERAAAQSDTDSGKPARKAKAYRELFKHLRNALGTQGDQTR